MLLVPERRRSRRLPTRDPRGASISERSNQNRIARADVLRRNEGTCFSSPSDDEVGGCQRAIRAERASASGAIKWRRFRRSRDTLAREARSS